MSRKRATAYDLAATPYSYQVAVAEQQGWHAAVTLCQRLAAGYPPPPVPGTSPNGEPVLLNAEFDCLSWFAAQVIPDERRVAAFGAPWFVAAAVALGAAANRRERARAEALSRPRWHSHGRLQVLVTAAATWYGSGAQWRCFRHDAVAGYEVVDGGATVRFASDVAPVRLVGPAAWCHAVLLAYAQYGPDAYLQAPYLEPLRQLALQSVAGGLPTTV